MADFINNKADYYNNSKYEILTPVGFKDFKGLLVGKNITIRLYFDICSDIECTSEHKLIVDSHYNFKFAKDLNIGDKIFTKIGYATIINKTENVVTQKVFDFLEIKDNHMYVVNKDIYCRQCLFLDEYAFVPNEIAEDFYSAVYPTITRNPKAKIIICSTPNGLNHFYDIYKGAVSNQNNYRPVKVNWWEVEGQDEAWKKRIIRDLGVIRFNQEYGNKFLGSSVTLVDSDILERINPTEPIMTKYGDLMKIFEQPMTGKHHYICSIDTAGGVGSDYSVIQVIKVMGYNNIEQVATYACNTIKPFDFAEVCIAVSEYYLNSYMMIENNEMGGEVANRIWFDYECDRVLNTDPKGIGTRSTRKTKLIANMLTKRYLEEGWLKIHNYETIRQFSLYEEITPNVFKGPRTDNDDHVTSILWAIYYLQTPFYTDGAEVVRKEIRDVYKLIPDEESDKAILSRNRIAGGVDEVIPEGDGIIPIMLDDEFEWPEDLNS